MRHPDAHAEELQAKQLWVDQAAKATAIGNLETFISTQKDKMTKELQVPRSVLVQLEHDFQTKGLSGLRKLVIEEQIRKDFLADAFRGLLYPGDDLIGECTLLITLTDKLLVIGEAPSALYAMLSARNRIREKIDGMLHTNLGPKITRLMRSVDRKIHEIQS